MGVNNNRLSIIIAGLDANDLVVVGESMDSVFARFNRHDKNCLGEGTVLVSM